MEKEGNAFASRLSLATSRHVSFVRRRHAYGARRDSCSPGGMAIGGSRHVSFFPEGGLMCVTCVSSCNFMCDESTCHESIGGEFQKKSGCHHCHCPTLYEPPL